MQPFPTAFWKKTAEPVIEEVSCFTPVNAIDSNGDGVYALQAAATPDAEGNDGVGIYRDFNEESLAALTEGFPVLHASRADGFDLNDVSFSKNWENLVIDLGLGTGETNEGQLTFFVLDNWVYIWREGGVHKSNPITITNDEDCKKSTIKCYFSKDATQRLLELEEHIAYDGNYMGASQQYIIDTVEGDGFNGFFSYLEDGATALNNEEHPHYFYRQKAKVRIKFNTGGQNLTVKIKGLGTDDNTRYSIMHGLPKYDLVNGPNDQSDLAFFNQATSEYSNSRFNTGVGDLQSCEIFLNGSKQIKCIAPMLGYFTEYPGGEIGNANYFHSTQDSFEDFTSPFGDNFNIYKGPVRIFEQSGGVYVGAGSGHPINGLGYIDSSKFSAGYPDSEYVVKNPYGSDYLPNDSIFYDAFSNITTPDYASPYQYTKEFTTSNGLGNGEQTIDIVFDSVTEAFLGGAYYEIELSYT